MVRPSPTDRDYVEFLIEVLPRLGLRWRGFRKPRRQVCRRIAGRIAELGLTDLGDYRRHLDAHPDEWPRLESLCRVTISRMFRDRVVFETLERGVLPDLARRCLDHGRRRLNAWSAGCASGEEAWSLSLLWRHRLQARFPDLTLDVLGTDLGDDVLLRAHRATYPPSSLREVPRELRARTFDQIDGELRLRDSERKGVRFERRDLRRDRPDGPFDVILCRNLAFTYFDDDVQREVLTALVDRLVVHGRLLIGSQESLPDAADARLAMEAHGVIYKRTG